MWKSGLCLICLTSFAYAQDTSVQSVIEMQRNMALSWHAQAEARAQSSAAEVTKLKAEIEELKKTCKKED